MSGCGLSLRRCVGAWGAHVQGVELQDLPMRGKVDGERQGLDRQPWGGLNLSVDRGETGLSRLGVRCPHGGPGGVSLEWWLELGQESEGVGCGWLLAVMPPSSFRALRDVH